MISEPSVFTNEPTRLSIFTAAPHRMMFFGGAVQLIAVLLFWGIELAGRYTHWWEPLEISVPATSAHSFLMTYGLFTFFFFGFLMTTYPRWLNGTPVERKLYITVFSLLFSGIIVFYTGLFVSEIVLLVGLAAFIGGFGLGIAGLFRVYFGVSGRDKNIEKILNVALSAGFLGVLSFFVWLLSGITGFLVFSQKAGVWLFLVPMVFVVCYRMIPFFSSCVLQDYEVVQPRWSIQVVGAGVIGHMLLDWFGQLQWLWLFDVPMMLTGLYLTFRWKFRRSFEVGLLAVLHLAFLWFSLAMALYSIQSLVMLTTGSFILGKAPLHALGIGFITSMVVAMVTRVTLGHSGRTLQMDTLTWLVFTGIGITALLRIAAEIPALEALSGSSWNLLAGATWLFFLLLWVMRYGPMYLKPKLIRDSLKL